MSRVPTPLAAVALSLLYGWLSSVSSFAQQPGRFGGQNQAGPNAPPANEVIEFEGSLRGVRGNVLIVKKEDDTEAQVMMPDLPVALTFVAKAEMEFLRPGMSVRFEAEFDRSGMPTGPVDKVEIFHPMRSPRMSRAMRERYLPGLYPKDDEVVPQAGPAMYRVVGNVAGMDESGALLVRAGARPVRVELTEEPNFEIRFNHLNLARPDDTVEVSGFFQPPDETRIKAERVTVKSDRVFGEEDDETASRRGARDRRRPRGAAGDRSSRNAAKRRAGGRNN